MLDVNLVGAFLGMQAVLDPMRARGGGSIVNVSSLAGLTGLPYHGAYGASKWALRGMSRTAAVEFGPDGIRVNSVHPGPIDTPMLPAPAPGTADDRFAHLPLGRAGRPDEVAALVLHLASDESSYQTGGEYMVDGGSHAGPPKRYEWSPT
jgi:3alpha(or 20beta)-hydroxysteroid dehydrogenase